MASRPGSGVSAVNARNGEGMVFANNDVCALLLICGQVAIGKVVAGQTVVPRYSGAFENRQGETWKPTHVNLVGRQTHCRADLIVVSELDVKDRKSQSSCCSLTTRASISAILWFTRSKPPLPLG